MSAEPHVPAFAAPPDDTGPKRALILSGGGIRLSYQAGVLRALAEDRRTFQHIDSSSGGSLNNAMLFSGLAPEEMCDRWRTLNIRDTISLLPLKEYLQVNELTALGDSDGLRKKVYPHLGIDVEKINAARGLQGTFNLFNYDLKVNLALPHQELTTDFLVAGMSLPGTLPPVEIDGTPYLDSAFVLDANPLEAVRRGAEELWLVWALGNTGHYNGGAFGIYMNLLQIASNGGLNMQFDRILDLNARIERGEPAYGQTRPIRLHLIQPTYPLPLDPALYLGQIDNASLIDMGYSDARGYLARRGEEGVALAPESLRQISDGVGITFQETAQGGIALGETDPKADQGASTELKLHATVRIHDVERFISDPDHTGELFAHIDYPPIGTNISGWKGTFNLFEPAGDAATKRIVYEIAFDHAGESYYLAGVKEIRDNFGGDLWRDATRIRTRIHRGTDATGPVVATGVLTLGLQDVIHLVKSFHAIDTATFAEKKEAVLTFGRFFLGGLWDTYVKHLSFR